MSDHAIILRKIQPGSSQRCQDIERVMDHLFSLEENKSWRVKVEQAKSERSLDQNAYLFGVAYKELSKVLGYEKAELHRMFCKLHFGSYMKRIPPTKLTPGGLEERPVRTTTTDENGHRSVLNWSDFWEFVELVQRWGAEQGIDIKDPDPAMKKALQDELAKKQKNAA